MPIISGGSSSAGGGREIGYDQITSPVTIASSTEASGTTIISCAAHVFDGTPVICEFYSPTVGTGSATGAVVIISLFEAATQIGRLAYVAGSTTVQINFCVLAHLRFSPTTGSHTYTVTACSTPNTNGAPTVNAGVGGTGAMLPAFCRFTKV